MNTQTTTISSASKTVLLAGLVAGILDAIAAMVSTMLATGRGPEVVWKFVASGVFGVEKAFAGGTTMVILGLLFHMIIAMFWALAFFYIYPKLKGFGRHFGLGGLLYGIVVWCGMNLVVVPFSNTPEIPFTLSGTLRSMAYLMFCVGLPISFITHRYYSRLRS